MEYRIILAILSGLVAALIAFTNPAEDLFRQDVKVFSDENAVILESPPEKPGKF